MNAPQIPPNQCPACSGEVRVAGEALFGDQQCPHCGKKLWFLAAASEAKFIDYDTSEDLRERAFTIIAEKLEVDRDRVKGNPLIMNDLAVDSLDAIELIMDLEDELGLGYTDVDEKKRF